MYAWLTLCQSNTVQKCLNHSSFPQIPYPAVIQAHSCTLMQNRGNKVSPSVVISIMEPRSGVVGSIILEPENNDDGVVGKEKLASDDGVV
jgi:hypothetical protein